MAGSVQKNQDSDKGRRFSVFNTKERRNHMSNRKILSGEAVFEKAAIFVYIKSLCNLP